MNDLETKVIVIEKNGEPLSLEEAISFLATLQYTGEITAYVKEHFPDFIYLENGKETVASFSLLAALKRGAV